jgi:phosphoglycerate-specific signal transduction histidine kinase
LTGGKSAGWLCCSGGPVPDLPAPTIQGDPGRLQQVVWNLLSNAVKFTPKGGRVDVRLQPEKAQVRIVVQDSGQGIKPEFLPNLLPEPSSVVLWGLGAAGLFDAAPPSP